MSVIIDAGLKCCASLLQREIVQIGRIAIVVFALHKCGDLAVYDHLTVMAAQRLALDGDFGIANRDDAEQRGAPIPPIVIPGGMKAKNTSDR